ncbi:hypothetical protein TSAR_001419 [Trichomalopsis sarcophagae]|uniref:Uncharacterized protein n=1 Tax=Trichomalopsis sarcophagae TaxID=543379 RepID=A0A232EQG6_9HYME|nr:hypothetical protein TSAR_001419 [Trichomalopsis sarcophagae]
MNDLDQYLLGWSRRLHWLIVHKGIALAKHFVIMRRLVLLLLLVVDILRQIRHVSRIDLHFLELILDLLTQRIITIVFVRWRLMYLLLLPRQVVDPERGDACTACLPAQKQQFADLQSGVASIVIDIKERCFQNNVLTSIATLSFQQKENNGRPLILLKHVLYNVNQNCLNLMTIELEIQIPISHDFTQALSTSKL